MNTLPPADFDAYRRQHNEVGRENPHYPGHCPHADDLANHTECSGSERTSGCEKDEAFVEGPLPAKTQCQSVEAREQDEGHEHGGTHELPKRARVPLTG